MPCVHVGTIHIRLNKRKVSFDNLKNVPLWYQKYLDDIWNDGIPSNIDRDVALMYLQPYLEEIVGRNDA